MPESIGKTLKRIRESKRFSIEEVSERSRIPKNIVFIIEEDRLNEIKSGFYAKSFVKTYASFLGVLNEPVVMEYLNSSQPQKKSEPVSKLSKKQITRKIPQIGFSGIAKYKKQIIAVIISILALCILSMAVGQAGKFIKSMPVKKQTKAVVTKKSEFIEVEVSASDNTYLQIICDNDILFKGLFKKGGNDTWKAKKEIKLEAGNSGVVKININGKPADFSGKKGKKKEITITKDGIK